MVIIDLSQTAETAELRECVRKLEEAAALGSRKDAAFAVQQGAASAVIVPHPALGAELDANFWFQIAVEMDEDSEIAVDAPAGEDVAAHRAAEKEKKARRTADKMASVHRKLNKCRLGGLMMQQSRSLVALVSAALSSIVCFVI